MKSGPDINVWIPTDFWSSTEFLFSAHRCKLKKKGCNEMFCKTQDRSLMCTENNLTVLPFTAKNTNMQYTQSSTFVCHKASLEPRQELKE